MEDVLKVFNGKIISDASYRSERIICWNAPVGDLYAGYHGQQILHEDVLSFI